MSIIIEAKNLSKTYEMGSSKVEALKDVNLCVEQGSFVAITGTSGSGKSTLLHLLGALDFPSSGEVIIDGKSFRKYKEKELASLRRDVMGFVFQNFCLIKELPVRENIILPVVLSGKQMQEEYLNDLCDMLGISDRLSHMPWELSGGQRQRVAIARALANNPEIIFCDEPTGNLDKKTSAEVMNLLHSIHEKYRKTILVVTHDKEVAENSDYNLRIEDGSLLFHNY